MILASLVGSSLNAMIRDFHKLQGPWLTVYYSMGGTTPEHPRISGESLPGTVALDQKKAAIAIKAELSRYLRNLPDGQEAEARDYDYKGDPYIYEDSKAETQPKPTLQGNVPFGTFKAEDCEDYITVSFEPEVLCVPDSSHEKLNQIRMDRLMRENRLIMLGVIENQSPGAGGEIIRFMLEHRGGEIAKALAMRAFMGIGGFLATKKAVKHIRNECKKGRSVKKQVYDVATNISSLARRVVKK